jgi:hypothetical protein
MAHNINRIDTPFLALGVGWIMDKIPLDSYPVAFRKDLLIHEAVRNKLNDFALSLCLELTDLQHRASSRSTVWLTCGSSISPLVRSRPHALDAKVSTSKSAAKL